VTTKHPLTVAPDYLGGREWAHCDACGKYRPLEGLEKIAIGRRYSVLVCDECAEDDAGERWYREWECHD